MRQPISTPSDRFPRPATTQSAAWAAHGSDHVLRPATGPDGEVIPSPRRIDSLPDVSPIAGKLEPWSGDAFPVGMFEPGSVPRDSSPFRGKRARWALIVWQAVGSVAASYRMSDSLHEDRDSIAADAFLNLASRVASHTDGFTWSDCLLDGRPGRSVYRAVADAVRREASRRGECILESDRDGSGTVADDIVGRCFHSETRRQAFARLALRDLAGLARADSNVRAYLNRAQGEAVPDAVVSDARNMRADGSASAESAAVIRSANRAAHNAVIESVGRARRDVARGKATRTQRAAVAVADVLDGYGFREPVAREARPVKHRRNRGQAVPVGDVTVYRAGEDVPPFAPSDVSGPLAILRG